MLFNSPQFLLLFLPLSVATFWLACRHDRETAVAALVITSLIFYASWDPRFLFLLLGSAAINFVIGSQLTRSPSKALLAAGLGFNLGVIGLFKYGGFFTQIVNSTLGANIPVPDLILPLGISFFTFQKIAYLVDCHTRKIRNPASLGEFALFVAFFPQLIAGPIVHYRDIVPQFAAFGPQYQVSPQVLGRGLFLIVVGLFKKVVIADNLARYTDPAFAAVGMLSFYDAWAATLAYALQLYFDFSAYGEIAMGLGLLFGVRLPVNFNSPYKATDIRDFWRRWHITLGLFLRDYLYIPLGGSRKGPMRLLLAATLTMFLGGLWHGAAWHYVVWGLIHGLGIAGFALWRRAGITLPKPAAHAATFLFVALAWVMFRAPSVPDALTLYATLFGANGLGLPAGYAALLPASLFSFGGSSIFNGLEIFPFLWLIHFTMTAPNVHEEAEALQARWQSVAMLGICSLLVAFNLGDSQTFAYWNF